MEMTPTPAVFGWVGGWVGGLGRKEVDFDWLVGWFGWVGGWVGGRLPS